MAKEKAEKLSEKILLQLKKQEPKKYADLKPNGRNNKELLLKALTGK